MGDNNNPQRANGRLKRDLPFSRTGAESPLPSKNTGEAKGAAAAFRRRLEGSPSRQPISGALDKKPQRPPDVPALPGLGEKKPAGEQSRPAAVVRGKTRNGETVRLPTVQLKSAKLVEAVQSKKQTESDRPTRPRLVSEQPDVKTESLEALGKQNPLWAEILGRETSAGEPLPTGRVLRSRRKAGTRNADWHQEGESKRSPAAAKQRGLEEDWFYDSPLPFREYRTSKGRRVWRGIQAVVRSRRFSQAVAAVIILTFASTLNVPWQSWFSRHLSSTKDSLATSINSLSRPIEERAAFFIAEDFQKGLDAWAASQRGSVDLDSNGLLQVKGLALHEKTLSFANYRLDFEAKIQSGALGWVVRAADYDNYYAYKLVESRRQRGSSFHLERYSVIDGIKVASAAASKIPLPSDLAHSGVFNSVSVRVRDDQITTMVNGWGIDFWRDSRLERGGIGFFSDSGQSALISQMNISGNNDSWGLLLYGTVETLRSIRDTISPSVAMTPGPQVSAPVAVVWHPLARPRQRY